MASLLDALTRGGLVVVWVIWSDALGGGRQVMRSDQQSARAVARLRRCSPAAQRRSHPPAHAMQWPAPSRSWPPPS